MFAAHDANYNCIGLTDKAGNEVEKYSYTSYGRVVADQLSGRGDFDGHVAALTRRGRRAYAWTAHRIAALFRDLLG